jgi:hypothetical protein
MRNRRGQYQSIDVTNSSHYARGDAHTAGASQRFHKVSEMNKAENRLRIIE